MIKADPNLTANQLLPSVNRLFDASAAKLTNMFNKWNPSRGTPVYTVNGEYTSRGWTEWTQGFMFGSAILQYDATGDRKFLELGREGTVKYMASHISHIGVHDHGFNNVSTYGNLMRLMDEGRIEFDARERDFYELALKLTGAIQAARWTQISPDRGYVYSFNGPHSLFSDTIRSMRALVVSHQLGHALMTEKDVKINLLERMIQHCLTTAKYNVYFGKGRDLYDIRGRVVHESIFNTNDGSYRCPSTQQGYTPFSTWTRGLAWILTGYAEELEYFDTLSTDELAPFGGKEIIMDRFLMAAQATADFFIQYSPTDGIPYWDTGAPGLVNLGDYLNRPSEPYNDHEPIDSSAAAIAAQGYIRLGNFLKSKGNEEAGNKYRQVGLTMAKHLFESRYLSEDPNHEGLIMHSVYHRPNNWDNIPAGRKVPCDEATMWGDYHARELALMVQREANDDPYYTFFLKR
jgi:unsaturated chondroitin disaccharide hydrolase